MDIAAAAFPSHENDLLVWRVHVHVLYCCARRQRLVKPGGMDVTTAFDFAYERVMAQV